MKEPLPEMPTLSFLSPDFTASAMAVRSSQPLSALTASAGTSVEMRAIGLNAV